MPLGAAPINQQLLDALAEQERQRLAKIEEEKRNARLQPTTPPPLGAPPSAVPMPYTPPLDIPREPRNAALAAPVEAPAPNVTIPLAPVAPGQDPGYQGTLGPKGTGLPISGRFDTLNGPGRVMPPGEPELDPSNPAGSANPPNFNAAQRYLGGQKIAGMVDNLNAMEGVGPNAPIEAQPNAMVGGPLPRSLSGTDVPFGIASLQNRANAGAEAGVVPGLEKDHPTKWGRFKNALGAFGLSMLQGRGLLGSGYAAYEGAKASQRGPAALGRFGDRMEDAEDIYDAEVKAKKAEAIDAPMKTKREVEEQMARIRLLNAQAGYQEAKPELDAKKIKAQAEDQMRRAAEANDDDLVAMAQFAVRQMQANGQTPDPEVWKVATGGLGGKPIPPGVRYSIVAGYDAVYAVNPRNPNENFKIGGVVPKPPADPGLGNRAELEVRRRLGDPEGPQENPEYKAWLETSGQNELLNTYAGENMQNFGMDQATYRDYIGGKAPQEVKEKVWQAWQALTPEQQDAYAAKVKGAPKRTRKNSEDPEWNARYNREVLEEERKYRGAPPAQPTTAGAAPVADPRSEAQVQADGRAWAEKNKATYNNDVNAAYEAYMAKWREQRAAANK